MLALPPILDNNVQMHWDGFQWWERDPNNVLLRRVEMREALRQLNDDHENDAPFNYGAFWNARQRAREHDRQQTTTMATTTRTTATTTQRSTK